MPFRLMLSLLYLCISFCMPVSQAYADALGIAWDAPTTNEDGSPLTDLVGYNVYYDSNTPVNLTTANRMNLGNITTASVSFPSDGVTYYIVVTAVDTSGNESVVSNQVSYTSPLLDSDGDGIPDTNDGCPNDVHKTAPGVCGCGVADTDTDADGTPDCVDQCTTDPNKISPGACGCGVIDSDTDGDGTPDCLDQCSTDPGKIHPGACGCGVVDTDTDGDGILDCNESCDTDPNKTSPGICGCGVADTDSDGDGISDCQDPCPNDPNGTTPETCGGGVTGLLSLDWNDTDANNSLQAPASPYFAKVLLGSETALRTQVNLTNIHSHVVLPMSAPFEYLGRMMMTQTGSGMGVTFLSDYPNSDSYHRLRTYSGEPFHLASHPHGTNALSGTTSTGVVPQANIWYHFRIRVSEEADQTRIEARVWEEGAAEPSQFQVNALYSNEDQPQSGTFGVWSMGGGERYWSDLEVQPLETRARSTAPMDLDGDGISELAVFDGSSYFVLFSSIEQALEVSFGHESQTSAISDYDGDGIPDLATAHLADSEFSATLLSSSNANGSLESLQISGFGDRVHLGCELNGTDGDEFVSITGNELSVRARDGSLVSSFSIFKGLGTAHLQCADLDADGTDELIFQGRSAAAEVGALLTPHGTSSGEIQIVIALSNDGTVLWVLPSSDHLIIFPFDLDGDGILESIAQYDKRSGFAGVFDTSGSVSAVSLPVGLERIFNAKIQVSERETVNGLLAQDSNGRLYSVRFSQSAVTPVVEQLTGPLPLRFRLVGEGATIEPARVKMATQ